MEEQKYYTFPCGCRFEVADATKQTPDGTPLLRYSSYEINYNCQAVWDMLGEGRNIGVFQLESNLGKQWVRRLKPTELNDIIALGSLLRPGCLQSKDEKGISMTEHYVLRKNKKEEVECVNKLIEDILSNTYGVMCFQEQGMQIVAKLGNFTPQEVDRFRKSAGKKDTAEMDSVLKLFVEKAEAYGQINKEEATRIANLLRASQRYAFNRAHAASYGQRGYQTAYLKAHVPVTFFLTWLEFSEDRQGKKDDEDSAELLIEEAKYFNIETCGPNLLDRKANFYNKGKKIYFGLTNVSGIGKSVFNKITAKLKDEHGSSWYSLLCNYLFEISEGIAAKLINCGATSFINLPRKRQHYELARLNNIFHTKNEVEWFRENRDKFIGFADLIPAALKLKKEGGAYSTAKRLDNSQSEWYTWNNPTSPLEDDILDLITQERSLLGVSLTHATANYGGEAINCTCKLLYDKKVLKNATILVSVTNFKQFVRKNGQPMAKAVASDGTCKIDIVVFPNKEDPERFEKDCSALQNGKPVILNCNRWNDSFIVNKVTEI